MHKHRVAVLTVLTFASILLILGIMQISSAGAGADKKQSPAKPGANASKKATPPSASNDPTPTMVQPNGPLDEFPHDPAFERHFDLAVLRNAMRSFDPAALADAGLLLAEGERVLLRCHRSGITAEHVLQKAAMLAVRKGDTGTLERLARAAEKMGNKKLRSFVRNTEKLAHRSRKLDPGLHVSVLDMSADDFAHLKSLWCHICLAELLADPEELKTAEFRLGIAKHLPEVHINALKKKIANARKHLPATPSQAHVALAKLMAVSRDDATSSWDTQYSTPGGGFVNAQVVIQGDRGYYAINGQPVGQFWGIHCMTDTHAPLQPGGGPPQIVYGNWRFTSTGDTGRFEWHVTSDGSRFQGRWSSPTLGYGTWSGQRSGGGNAGPDNGGGSPNNGGTSPDNGGTIPDASGDDPGASGSSSSGSADPGN